MKGLTTNLASIGSLLSELDGNVGSMCEEVSLDIENLRAINQRRNLGRREVRLLVLLRNAKSSDEGAGEGQLSRNT